MLKIGTLQNSLEDLFQECTIQFVNKKHSIQLQYKVEKKSRILVVTQIFRHNPEKALFKVLCMLEMRKMLIFSEHICQDWS